MSDSVFVLHTGGTIGMVDTPDGYAPVAGALGPYLDWIVENSRGELPPIEFLELDPPIDSANATPDDWCAIARMLYERREDHPGFVVLHGTDTMAYTSSALSFLLPVVRQAGRRHRLADPHRPHPQRRTAELHRGPPGRGPADVHEVTLLFGEVLLRGNRATKIDASGLDAFDSPRFPPLADIGIDIVVNQHGRCARRGRAAAHRRAARQRRRGAAVPRILGIHPREPLPAAAAGSRHRGLRRRQRTSRTTGTSWQRSRPPPPQGIVVVVVTQCVRGSVQPGRTRRGRR